MNIYDIKSEAQVLEAYETRHPGTICPEYVKSSAASVAKLLSDDGVKDFIIPDIETLTTMCLISDAWIACRIPPETYVQISYDDDTWRVFYDDCPSLELDCHPDYMDVLDEDNNRTRHFDATDPFTLTTVFTALNSNVLYFYK